MIVIRFDGNIFNAPAFGDFDPKKYQVFVDEHKQIEIEYKGKKYILVVTKNDKLLLNKK
jgi:hypothetical protein